MTRTLITGASGFTGRYLAAALQKAGHDVHVIVQEGDTAVSQGLGSIHHCDLTNAAACEGVVTLVAPEKVAHLAAISFVAHENAEEMYRVNVIGTRNLLNALANQPIQPWAVLVASSANVYGNGSSGVLTEDSPLCPANDYGVSKAAMEMLCGLYASRLPLIIARPFNYTGVGQPSRFLIPKIVDHARRDHWRIELGNTAVARDFSDVRTIVDAYVRLLAEPRAVGGTFQICSGRAISLDHILETVGTIRGQRFSVTVNPTLVRPNEVTSLCGTPARIESVIGPLHHVPLRETLERMLGDAP